MYNIVAIILCAHFVSPLRYAILYVDVCVCVCVCVYARARARVSRVHVCV